MADRHATTRLERQGYQVMLPGFKDWTHQWKLELWQFYEVEADAKKDIWLVDVKEASRDTE